MPVLSNVVERAEGREQEAEGLCADIVTFRTLDLS
jgi:hypothetical protein